MKYPIKIVKLVTENAYEVTVPDLPGCKAKASTIDQSMSVINTVIAEHLTILAEYGETIPHASSIDEQIAACQNESPIWAVIDFDIVPYLGKSQKINVTLPELLIKKIDDRVGKSASYKTRSGFIATSCMNELLKEAK